MNSIEIDKISRDKIRNNIDCNYFVEAGAGSGKTSILVDRMLAMVESGIDISKICAITFTKAAAGEFFQRFQEALSKSKTPNAQNALKNIDLCFMGTIDSFCNLILSEHPIEAKIPSSSSIVDADELKEIYTKKLSDIALGVHGTDLQKKCWRFKKYVSFYENVFVNGLNILTSTRNANLQVPNIDTSSFEDTHKAKIEIIRNTIQYIQEHPEIRVKGDKACQAAWKCIDEETSVLFESWDENLYLVNSALKKLRGLRLAKEFDIKNLGLNYDKIFESYPDSEKLKYWAIKENDDPLLLQAIEDFQFRISLDFINDATKIICDELRKLGKLTFFDYLLYLRDMLKEDTSKDGKLIKHIYNRHSYFLIDEFQDTNPIQAEIFFYLCAQNPVEDWTKCIPKPGSLFVVGDPKQSIYRFRNADVASFLRVKKLFNPPVGEVLLLSQNFRSAKPICKYFNDCFNDLLSTDTENQCKFSEIPLDEKLDDPTNLAGAYKFSYAYKDRSETPDAIAKIITGIVQDQNTKIFDHRNNKIFHPGFKDFMLITPTKPKLLAYMQAFINWNIPFIVEGQTLFNDCPSLLCLSRLIKAIANPKNKDAIFGAKKLSGVLFNEEDIKTYSKLSINVAPSTVAEMLLEEKEILTHSSTHNLEYMYYALELLKNGESSGEILSIQDANDFLEKLVLGDSGDIERCIQLSKDNDRVKLANLHKVKGLEAPIVILGGPSMSSKKAEYRMDYSTATPVSYIFSLAYSGDNWPRKVNLNTSENKDEKEEEEYLLNAEVVRLLYVAATRACNTLIIENPLDAQGMPRTANPWTPLLSKIENEIEIPTDVNIVNRKELYANDLFNEAKENLALVNTEIKNSSYKINRPSEIKESPKIQAEDLAIDDISDNDEENLDARLIGTVVHKLMEMIVSSNFSINIDDAILEISNEYNLDKKTYSEKLSQVQNQVAPFIEKLKEADEIYCELPFCYLKDENTVSNGVIDLIYKLHGQWHIIDYKTNASSNNLEEKYATQLQEYIDAFKKISGYTADAKIYHIAVN